MRALDSIDEMFAKLAATIDEISKSSKEFAAITAGLALGRTVVTDLRRIADACEQSAKENIASQQAYRDALARTQPPATRAPKT